MLTQKRQNSAIPWKDHGEYRQQRARKSTLGAEKGSAMLFLNIFPTATDLGRLARKDGAWKPKIAGGNMKFGDDLRGLG